MNAILRVNFLEEKRLIFNKLFYVQKYRMQDFLNLDMDVVESVLGYCASGVCLPLSPVVFLNCNLVARNLAHPCDMSSRSLVALSNTSGLGGFVDSDAAGLGRLIPRVGVAPVVALVMVGELDAQSLVDAICDKAGALALVEGPGVNTTALSTVGIVVGLRARDSASSKLVRALAAGGGERRGCREQNGGESEELHFEA